MREIADYFEDILKILGDEVGADRIWDDEIQQRGHHVGGLLFVLGYPDGSELHVELWVNCADDPVIWTNYSFHFQDKREELRFRHDNSPHHPELPTFPHHVHLPGGTRGLRQPHLREIANRIRSYLH